MSSEIVFPITTSQHRILICVLVFPIITTLQCRIPICVFQCVSAPFYWGQGGLPRIQKNTRLASAVRLCRHCHLDTRLDFRKSQSLMQYVQLWVFLSAQVLPLSSTPDISLALRPVCDPLQGGLLSLSLQIAQVAAWLWGQLRITAG